MTSTHRYSIATQLSSTITILTHVYFLALSEGLQGIHRSDILYHYLTGCAFLFISIILRALNEIFYDNPDNTWSLYCSIECLQYCICCQVAWPSILFFKVLRVLVIPIDALISFGFSIFAHMKAGDSGERRSFVLCSMLMTNDVERAYFDQLSLPAKYWNLIASLVGGGRWIIYTLPHVRHIYHKSLGHSILMETTLQNIGVFMMASSSMMQNGISRFSCRSCNHNIEFAMILSMIFAVISAVIEIVQCLDYLKEWNGGMVVTNTDCGISDEKWLSDETENESAAFLSTGIEILEQGGISSNNR